MGFTELKMTSSILNSERRRRAGFTLAELLVVIGIMAVLMGLLLPALTGVSRHAERLKAAADLQAIVIALDAYKRDQGDYPRVAYSSDYTDADWAQPASERPNPPSGAQILCQALMSPGPATETGASGNTRSKADGFDGPGFKVRTGGKMWPAYLPNERFKIGDPDDPTARLEKSVLRFCILDGNGKPILYFPASRGKTNISEPEGYVGSDYGPGAGKTASERAMFDADDNLIWFGHPPAGAQETPQARMSDRANALKRIRLMLGEKSATLDGGINAAAGESPAFSGDYILWAAGPDQRFGPYQELTGPTGKLDEADAAKCDDVTNFRPQ